MRAAAALLIPLAALLLGAPAQADTLLDNVDGLTLDEQGGIERFTGMVIGRDGRVVQLLRRGDKRPARPDYLIDGKGRVAMPGLIDSHVQVMALGLSSLMLDLRPARSLAEAQARLAAYAAAHPDKPWILGYGWDQEAWGLGRMPTAADIDAVVGAVVGDRPVWLMRADGHAGWANAAALASAGVSAATRDPAGGRIERLPGGTGKPAGVLIETAAALVAKAIPEPRPEDRDLALENAQQALLAKGVTAVADMGTTIEDWQAYRRAGDAGTLRLRIMAYAAGIDATVLIAGPGPTPWLYDDRLRLNGVRFTLDGALGSRGALLKQPYADQPTARGLPQLDGTQLRNLMSRAAMDRFQVAIEAHGDAASAAALDAIGELAETYQGDRRWRIEQAQVIDPADLPRFGQSGVIVSMQPAGQAAGRLVAETRLGAGRLAGAHAWKSLTSAGARLAFGSGAPAEVPDPFAGMAAAMTRQDAQGEPFGGWQPQERLSRESALAAFTTGAAHAGFAEQRFGRLAAGQRADFLLLDRDPTLATPAELRAVHVQEVWLGGALAWRAAP